MLDATFFLKIGPDARDRYKDHIFRKALDVFGKPFSSNYSEPYKTNKSKGNFKRFAKAPKLNAPVLTSDLRDDFSLIKTTSGGFQLGFTTFGARVKHLKKMGRVLSASNQPLPDGVIKYLSKEARLYINKKLPKGKKTYRIGK